MPITEFLSRNAALYPDDISLVEINPEAREREGRSWTEYELVEMDPTRRYRRQITWKEFDEEANRFANALIADGIKKGDKVGILLMNCIEWLPVYFGVLRSGALAVPLNFRYTADEIRYCLDLAECDALIYGNEFLDRVDAVINEIPRTRLIYYIGSDRPGYAKDYVASISKMSSDDPEIELTDDDDAAIYFSSGTTGFPKAILHAHRALVHACLCEQKHHGQTRDDVFLCIPPLYHTGAKMHWFGSLLSGGRAVLLKGIKPNWIIEAVSNEHATIVWLLVPWAQDILDAIDRKEIDLSKYELSQWRLMHIGAQPVPPSLIKRWKKVFPDHDYDTNYGLSESTGPGCVHLGVENIDKVGAIGIPGYGWETRIVDEKRNDVEQGTVGELAVKGNGVMKCYYRDPAATAEVLQDGWLFTGDMAMQDSDGFIYLVDRKKDVIITGGENLYPVQIEDFIHTDEAVKDVAVIGIPDARLGEIAAAIIEIKEGYEVTEEDINEFCKALPRYKRPRKIIFDKVLRNPTGKIEKPKLREKYIGDSLVKVQITS